MRKAVIAAAAACLLSATHAVAQEVTEPVGAGAVEIAVAPGGGTFVMKSHTGLEPKFDSYTFGASAIGNLNRHFGIEGDVSFALGRQQDLDFSLALGRVQGVEGPILNRKTPAMLNYNGSLLYSPWGSDRRLAPYAAVGLGAMTMFNADDLADVGVTANRTYFTSNIGAGIKWFPVANWGVRGDYRWFIIQDRDDAPMFFGQENRNAHRVYGGLIFTY